MSCGGPWCGKKRSSGSPSLMLHISVFCGENPAPDFLLHTSCYKGAVHGGINKRAPGIYFDFQKVRQFEAGMDMVLIIFIVVCMVAESADLSATLDRIVVKPLER